MPQKENKTPEAEDPTKPVPKEGEDLEVTQQATASTGPQEQPTVPLAGPSATTPEQVATQPAQQPTQPQPPQQQVIVKEKKGGGLCNATTCCIGSCVGCLILIVILILLGIFAAPTLSKLLNRVINPGVSIPEVMEVDTEDLKNTLNDVASKEERQTITVTENEFNALLKEKYQNGDADLSLEAVVDFEQDTATVYMKLSEWMPWAVIEISNDENGELSTSSVKVGPIDLTNYIGDTIQKGIDEEETITSAEQLDLTSLFESVLFEDTTNKVTVQEIYFLKDQMEVVVDVPSQGPAVEPQDEFVDNELE